MTKDDTTKRQDGSKATRKKSPASTREEPVDTPGMQSEGGLAGDMVIYRDRLSEQSDEQLDAWMIELMRDASIRRGVLPVLADYREATGLDDNGIEKTFTAGGGPPATIGRTADGALMVPAISLHFLVPGLRSQSKKAREQIIDFLVAGFEEVVYI